jgi:glutamate 5-kinase
MNANHLILLTNEDGLLDQNNRVVSTLQEISNDELSLVNDSLSTSTSKGGMRSKLLAAQLAAANGINVTIANGRTPDILESILQNQPVGTTIKCN